MLKSFFSRFLILLFLIASFFSCTERIPISSEEEISSENADTRSTVVEVEEDSNYILSHTSGLIPRDQSIEIHTLIDITAFTPGEDITEKVLTFKPAIKGALLLEDNRTLRFTPEGKLDEGKKYEASLDLSLLYSDVKEELKHFSFSFQAMEQDFEVSFLPVDFEDSETLSIKGSIVTADDTENSAIEEILELPRSIARSQIHWEHNQKIHQFRIDGISQREDEQSLKFKWDGGPIGVNKSGNREIIIPGRALFELSDVKVFAKDSGNYVTLYFSNTLLASQNLNGIIELNGNSDVRTSISGNTLKIYPPNHGKGANQLLIHSSLKNSMGQQLGENKEITVAFYADKPELKMVQKSGIYVNSDSFLIPFDAISLQAVDIQVIRIFENNMIRFFQFNRTMTENNKLELVGRPVFQGSVELDPDQELDLYSWNRFSIDLSSYIKEEPGAVYCVYVNCRRSQSLYPGSIKESEDRDYMDALDGGNWDGPGAESSYWDYYDNNYYWRDRNDPTTDSYYSRNQRRIGLSVLASDIGIIAKGQQNNRMQVVLSSLNTTEPISDAEIRIFNYQLQEIGSGKSDKDGFSSIDCDGKPFVLTAVKGNQHNYLRVDDATALSLSSFDIEGTDAAEGIKGFIYGERGVWRPGDPIHLSFIMEDKNQDLPQSLPAVLEFLNPSGQVMDRQVNNNNIMGLYRFTLKTGNEDPTGNWTARIRVGGLVFEKSISVEMVKPNRLKVIFTPEQETFTTMDDKSSFSATLFSQWLHGATARGLKAQVDVSLKTRPTRFEGYPDYNFDDLSISFSEPRRSIFDGRLDDEGNAQLNFNLRTVSTTPGSLNAVFTSKVFEESGNFSINQVSYPYFPYTYYAGIRTPPGDRSRGMLLTDEDHQVDIITLNSQGEPVSRRGVAVKLYKLRWRWWWDKSPENLSNFMRENGTTLISQGTVDTEDGKGSWTLRVNYPSWGRYLILVEDPDGHRSSKIVYMDWPGWAGSPQRGGESANILSIYTDDKEYTTGDTVELSIPSSEGGRALVSIEQGSRIVGSWWVETEDKLTKHRFQVSSEMTPTAYIHVSLLQPVQNRDNDSPIRMYGITPISVKDPETLLHPRISMSDQLRPEQSFSISVSEEEGKTMAYTLAVIDDGLLDLTNFQTPNPWKHFYGREALSVRTWDLYKEVIGTMSGEYGTLLAAGGGDSLEDLSQQKQNRFMPVVIFEGPFLLGPNERKTHVLEMPQYAGSVRTMVIATNGEGAYGWTDNTSTVKEDMMVQGTLPRLAGPDETLSFPVTLFTGETNKGAVTIRLESSGNLSIAGPSEKTVEPGENGELTTWFTLKTGSEAEPGSIMVYANREMTESRWGTDIEIRQPNRIRTTLSHFTIESGEEMLFPLEYFGITGTNEGLLELSTMPPIDLERRSQWLIRYPHGCIEQTTSSVFPQLFLGDMKALTPEESQEIQRNINAGIERLQTFQLPSGGLSYWPGESKESDWGTTYAGHFLLEARKKGYDVPEEMISKWIDWQVQQANQWKGSDSLNQAYRLYTLALAGKSQSGAMNRLREDSRISLSAKWRLAAAFALNGKANIARGMVEDLGWNISPYRSQSISYGSDLRDKAMILETLALLDMQERAYNVLEEISRRLSSEESLSTQTLSYSLIAVAKYAEGGIHNDGMKVEYQIDEEQKISLQSEDYSVNVKTRENQSSIRIRNRGNNTLFAGLALTGIPAAGEEVSEDSNLRVTLSYLDSQGTRVHPENLLSGTDFMVIAKVENLSNADLEEIALSTIFPTGWEILNTRMDQSSEDRRFDQAEYQDFRDDRVHSYFDIDKDENKSFVFYITAAYSGSYYFPGVICESMYNMDIYSLTKGFHVEVKADLE